MKNGHLCKLLPDGVVRQERDEPEVVILSTPDTGFAASISPGVGIRKPNEGESIRVWMVPRSPEE